MGTDGQGVICLTREDGPVNNILLSSISPNLSGQVRGLLTDSCGTLWIGTKGDGLLSVPEYTAGLDAGRVSVYTPGQKGQSRNIVGKMIFTRFLVFQIVGFLMDFGWVCLTRCFIIILEKG